MKKYADPKGKIIGQATVVIGTELGTLTVNGFKVMQGSKAPWVSMPSENWTTAKGEKKFRDTVVPVDALKAEICKKILAEFPAPTVAA